MKKSGKIEKAFETWFLASLKVLNARKVDKALQWIKNYVENKEFNEGATNSRALLECHFLFRYAAKSLIKKRRCKEKNDLLRNDNYNTEVTFVCDVGLGGLARWLRATGYKSYWWINVDDEDLINLAIKKSAILLTTDTMLFERRILKDGTVRALWLPPTLKPTEQLLIIFDYFDLKVLEPRCMKCGGKLVKVDKSKVIDRIPPKTLKWINEYFLCSECYSLFWMGTHWRRITPVIEKLKKIEIVK